LVRGVESFFGDWDVFLSPVALTPAPLLGTIDANSDSLRSFEDWFDAIFSEFAAFTPVFNASGQPAMSVPLHQSGDGLPVGVHCAARVGDEVTLIRLASQFEVACPWIGRKPPVSVWTAEDDAVGLDRDSSTAS
jgi:amidase